MAKKRSVPWYQVDRYFTGFETDVEHEIEVQREAIPLVFVPGIMGSRLRRAGTRGRETDKDASGLPNMRWDPGSALYMLGNFSGEKPAHRKSMLIGDEFKAGYLEVADAEPVGDGFDGIMDDYRGFLKDLKKHDWGALAKIFEFPVYAVGYNWTASNADSGERLARRIDEIKNECAKVTGLCDKVILISHSMGGLVCRAASELHGAKGNVLGIIHGVQPATGAPAAYWRMKAGFEGFGMTSRVLGNSGPNVTPILGNSPGGLQLLPNMHYKTNGGESAWLHVTDGESRALSLPKSDPYSEIYSIPATGRESSAAPDRKYWGLVDPDLLDPSSRTRVTAEVSDPNDRLNAQADPDSPWERYASYLEQARTFHAELGLQTHDRSYCCWGTGHDTADHIELRVESVVVNWASYPTRGFRGYFQDAHRRWWRAELQDPSGEGDGTVPSSSASSLNSKAGKTTPHNRAIDVEHQPAFEESETQEYTIAAIVALAALHFVERR
ncbi:MAG: hypothetical protein IT531_07375 [Burkholderiales bacterium]|nr:hypothetical protein [Burkholderiales bacterium]